MKANQRSIGLILAILLALALLLAGFLLLPKLNTQPPEQTASGSPIMKPEQTDTPASPTQEAQMKGNLMAWAETREEAERIAGLYDITLVMYTDKIALYDTDKDLNELIKLGEANGWPKLSKNNPVTVTQP